MDMNFYLMFNGNCVEAFERYVEIFGGKMLRMLRYSDMPEQNQFGDEVSDKVLHATIQICNGTLMGSDDPTGNWSKPGGMNVQVTFDSVEEAKRVFDKLFEGGEVRMPFEPTFWAKGFGMGVDRFGIPWMINCDAEPAG